MASDSYLLGIGKVFPDAPCASLCKKSVICMLLFTAGWPRFSVGSVIQCVIHSSILNCSCRAQGWKGLSMWKVILLSFFVLFGRREIRRIFLSKEKFEEADNNIVSLVVS